MKRIFLVFGLMNLVLTCTTSTLKASDKSKTIERTCIYQKNKKGELEYICIDDKNSINSKSLVCTDLCWGID